MNKRCLIICLCIILLLTGCYIPSDPSKETNPSGEHQNQQNATDSPVVTNAKPTIAIPTDAPKSEPIYRSERSAGELPDIDLKVLYLTVKEGDTDETNHTWKEINTYSEADYAQMGVGR